MSSVLEMFGREIGKQVVVELSKIYGFDREEAEVKIKLEELRVDIIEKKVRRKSSIILPFCGMINRECCNGIRLNHELYTQCGNEITDYTGIHPVCGTCSKQRNNNSNGEPTYGYIIKRLEEGEKFRVKGKEPVNYGNVMEKLNIKREEAEKAARELGWTIPESQFEVKRATRGRPKKDTTATDTASETSEVEPTVEKKQRGRPKKEKKVVSSNTGDDMIAALVENANNEAKVEEAKLEEAKVEKVEEPEADDEESISAQPIKMTKNGYTILESKDGEVPPGTDYLMNPSDNTLYHPNTHELVGTWNPTTNTIEQEESDEE